MAASGDDDGLDRVRRDLVDLVLREAGGRVAADPNSPVAQLLTGIVRREMATAVDELRHGGATQPLDDMAIALHRPHETASRQGDRPASSRGRDALIAGLAALVALLIFGAGFGLAVVMQPPRAPSAVAPVVVQPSSTPAAVVPGADGPTGMATQLQEQPR